MLSRAIILLIFLTSIRAKSFPIVGSKLSRSMFEQVHGSTIRALAFVATNREGARGKGGLEKTKLKNRIRIAMVGGHGVLEWIEDDRRTARGKNEAIISDYKRRGRCWKLIEHQGGMTDIPRLALLRLVCS